MRNSRNSIAVGLFLASALHAQYTVVSTWWQAGQGTLLPQSQDWDNNNGQLRILNVNGPVDTQNHPFFTPLGVNGRACVTCHQPVAAMSITKGMLQQRWEQTQGQDPVFAAIDGANCPSLPQGQMSSHSLLLNRGLFRIGLPWPPQAADGTAITPEFQIEVVNDPTSCNASSQYGLNSQHPAISVYRRPRLVANVSYVSGPDGTYLLADGRAQTLQAQATEAAAIHEQASTPLTDDQLQRIQDFETQIFAAQNWDIQGGLLNQPGVPPSLGVSNLAAGTTAPVPVTVGAFDDWSNAPGLSWRQQDFRQSVARGNDLFLTRQFQVSPGVTGTCASCHQPGTPKWMDIGTTNLPSAKNSPELPVFKITCNSDAPPHPVLGSVIYTQDPGRALISGKCADVGSILVQQFRGLAARAPYFSNGSAATLAELVDFYDQRFSIGLSDQDKQDLINLLSVF
jgi:cytochrome c peroxidase